LQAPAPSQVDAAVSVEVVVSQAAARQTAPMACSAHMLLPSHVPVVPHVAGAIARQVASGSAPPAGTGWQVPALPETAHEVHASQLGESQQTCSTQLPLMQVVPSVHDPPRGVRFVHEPLAHEKPEAQSLSPEQVVRHAAPEPHMYAPQVVGVCLHVPAPLQKPMGVSIVPMQAGIPHEVVAGAFWQAPAPSHVPTKPQGGLAAQRSWGSDASAGTSLHEPSWPEMLQAWQVPHIVLSQQTPSTHALPVRQSPSTMQGWPRRFWSPQEFFTRSQIAGDAQSKSPRQVAPQAAPLHTKGAHDCVLAGRHAPAPSQVRPSVCDAAPVGHDGGAHDVPAG
jgi:hypothetical protein